MALAKVTPATIGVDEIVISETVRLSQTGDLTLGVYEPDNRWIVIRRDQLSNPADYCGTLLHELTHAASATIDGTVEFEHALTQFLGVIASNALRFEN